MVRLDRYQYQKSTQHSILKSNKSRIRVLQSIGRGLRTSESKNKTTLYDISDDVSYRVGLILHYPTFMKG